MGKLIVWRILLHIDSRKASGDEGAGVRAKLDLIVHIYRPDIGDYLKEGSKIGYQVFASPKLKLFDWPLALVEDEVAQMIGHFRLMLLNIGIGAQQALFFSGE